MRTKALLLAAALTAAGIASTLAQSNVYSLNVVGYVNVTIPSGYTLIANPLDASNAGGNSISNLFNAKSQSGEALGNTVYSWNGSFFAANANDIFGGGWASPNDQYAPGKGFFINNPNPTYTNTFVGEVMQGALNVPLPSGYSVVASKVPQAGYVADLGLTSNPGDTIYQWNGSFFVAINNDIFGGGWDTSTGFPTDSVKGPYIDVAKSFFYLNNTGPSTHWDRNFTVP